MKFNQNPLVSVVVISYNHSRFIKENLDSIKAQTYSNIELIVGDDASQDNSVEVFEEWLKDNDYTAAFKNYHQVNTGLATMLNECIEKANGTYLKLIAADDFLHQDYILECVRSLERDNGDLIFTQATEIDENSAPTRENCFPIPEHPLQNLDFYLAHYNFISGSTLFYRKESFLKLGNLPDDILLEDYFLVLKACHQKMKFSYLPENLIFYRRHSGNITKMQALKVQVETVKLQLRFFKDKKYLKPVNHGIQQNIKEFGQPFISGIIKNYINHPLFSKRTAVMIITAFAGSLIHLPKKYIQKWKKLATQV